MVGKSLGALGALTLLASSLVALPAQAAGVTVTSPSCGQIKAVNGSGVDVVLLTDSTMGDLVGKGKTFVETALPGGEYVWEATSATTDALVAKGSVTVAPCAGTRSRPIEGEQSGDRLADMFTIQAGSGALYYYRTTATGLATGVRMSTGWGTTTYLQQVPEIDGLDSPNTLFTVRSDGTAWLYPSLGSGRLGTARRVATGLTGYTNFTVLQLNSAPAIGSHMLLASKGDTLYGFMLDSSGVDMANPVSLATGWGTTTRTIAMRNYDTDRFADVISIRRDGTQWAHRITFDMASAQFFASSTRIGTSWQTIATVASPGSINGDYLSDLVARRSDGNLYRYINSGGRLNAAVVIGRNWTGMRLIG